LQRIVEHNFPRGVKALAQIYLAPKKAQEIGFSGEKIEEPRNAVA
jgi:hypothetical protein